MITHPFQNNLADFISQRVPLKPFQQHVFVRPEIGTVEIYLEDVSYHAEWIKGEGADISILRAMDDNRVVGAILPLRNWNGNMMLFVEPKGVYAKDDAR